MGRHDHLVIKAADQLPHQVHESASVDDVVVLERVVHQQTAPTRPAEACAGRQERTNAQRRELAGRQSGVGLLVSFPSAINLSQVKIDADSPGTKVEIRAADSNNPDLASTRVIGSADLNGPETIVSLPQPQRAQYVIIWITQLGNGGAGKLVSQIGELIFTSAG